MTEEIKKILDYWQFYINESNNYKLLNVHFDEIKKVLDYITNLQKENLKLISENEAIKNIKYTVDETIYKQRNEKAVEYINKNKFKSSDGEICYFCNMKIIKDVLNILVGGNE